jgi:hypothetical protein
MIDIIESLKAASRNDANTRLYAPQVSPRQIRLANVVINILAGNGGGSMAGTHQLTNDDGTQMFVFGVTPMDASVRVGRAP